MPASKARIRANKKYNARIYEVVQCRVRKSEHINDRITRAVEAGHAKSRAEYITQALKDRLTADGIPE